MRFKEKQECDKCGKLCNNLHIYKSKLLCYWCYIQKVKMIWIGMKEGKIK